MPNTVTHTTEIPTIDVNLVEVITQDGRRYALDTASQLGVAIQSETQDAVTLIVKGALKAQKKRKVTITGNQVTLTDNVFTPELVKILQGGIILYEENYKHTVSTSVAAGTYSIELTDGEFVNFVLDDAVEDGEITYNSYTDTVTVDNDGDITTLEVTHTDTADGNALTTVKTSGNNITGYTPPAAGERTETDSFTMRIYSAVYDAAGELLKYERTTYPHCTGEPIALTSEDNVFRAPQYTINSAPEKGQPPYSIKYVKSLPEFAD